MDITKEELQKIIQEELQSILDEEQIEEKKGSKRQRKKKAKKKSNKICDKGIAWAKRTFDTYPSAYANLAASKYCKDPNYAKGSKKKNESIDEGELQKWVDEDWVRVTSSGKIAGKCGSSKDKKNPDRCLPRSKAQGMSKGERAATGKKKKAAQKSGKDSGKSSYVSNTKKGKVTKSQRATARKDEALYEAEITDDEKKELEDVSKQLKGAVKAHGNQAKTIDKALKNESLLKDPKVSKHLKYHIREGVGVDKNVFRPDSDSFYSLFREVRKLHAQGRYTLNENEKHYILETDIGKFGVFEGERVALDHPMMNEEKDPPIGKPMKNSDGGKKYKVYVRNPKTGNVKKITYGDAKGGLKGNWNSAEARKSFAARHKCADKKDRMSSGYWACRAHKDFGKNVPGRFW